MLFAIFNPVFALRSFPAAKSSRNSSEPLVFKERPQFQLLFQPSEEPFAVEFSCTTTSSKIKNSNGDDMRVLMFVIAVAMISVASFAAAQEKAAPMKSHMQKAEMSDAAYTAQALSSAPKSISKEAGVVRMDKDGKMRTLRESKNGFTCMVVATDKMCNDSNSMEFFGAMMKGEKPPEKLGISYMLTGDEGASNTDPKATKKTADNHWVVTGPHIMVTGAPAKSLGYTEAADPDPTKPYMMWAGTPYEHAMVPVGGSKPMAKMGMKMSDKK